jgi:hypothetical protein
LVCGAPDGFSPVLGFVEAAVPAVADPVWLLGTPVALVLALGAGSPPCAVALGGVEVELLWVAVMLAASPVEELGVVELEGGVVLELAFGLVVPGTWPEAVVLVCPLGLVAALAELGTVEAVLDALWDGFALASGVVLGAVGELELAAELGGIAEALLPLEDVLLGALALVGLLLLAELPAAALTVRCSSTFLIPDMDFAISLARFLSALEETVPVSIAVWFVTDTCTFANAGSWLNLDCNCWVRSPSLDPLFEPVLAVSVPALVWLDVAVLWELEGVDEFEVASCASMNCAVPAAKTNAKKILIWCFMGKSPGMPLTRVSEYLFTPTGMLLQAQRLAD